MAATEKAGLSQHRAELLAKVNGPTVDMMRSVGLSVTDLRRGELPKACRS